MSRLVENTLTAIEKYSMLDGKNAVAVAFSGGADSTALLDVLCGICSERGIRLEAIHVEHGIRGESSKRDAEHCERVCRERDVPFTLVCADVPALAAEWNCGVEEAGRRVRYESFGRICREKGIDAIATAHHAGDNLETLIFNIARGSGLRGLCGIPPVREGIIRPLIFCTREDIEDHCRANSLDFVTDETNESDEYTRNYIRHNLIPALEKLNPSAVESAAKMTALLREDEAYLSGIAAGYVDSGVAELSALPYPILKRALYARLPDGIKPGGINITAAAKAVRQGGDTRISVGQTTAFYIRGDRAYFAPDERQKPESADYLMPLIEDEVTALPTGGAVLLTRNKNRAAEIANSHRKFIQTSLNGDKISGNIFIRSRHPGDKIRVRGMNRTVKNLMQEAGIDAAERIALPCVLDDCGIIWIPHLPLRDGAAGDQIQILFFEREGIK